MADAFSLAVLAHQWRNEANDVVKAKAHTAGLKIGFLIGKKYSDEQKKVHLGGIQKYVRGNPGNWTRNDQISYVIDLSTAYRRRFMKE